MILKIVMVESVIISNSNKSLNKTKDVYVCVCVYSHIFIYFGSMD